MGITADGLPIGLQVIMELSIYLFFFSLFLQLLLYFIWIISVNILSQVVAAPYQDRLCLAVAKELERSFGGWTPPY